MLKTKTKGNIEINNELFGKYPTVKEIFENEPIKEYILILSIDLEELKNLDMDSLTTKTTKKIGWNIFKKYHSMHEFNNNDNKIIVSKHGIEEAIYKIFAVRGQRDLLKEHLIVLANLGIIIEHATLVNQTGHLKADKNPDILYWNYYLDGVIIDGKRYKIEFDVRAMNDDSNQFRVQRIELTVK